MLIGVYIIPIDIHLTIPGTVVGDIELAVFIRHHSGIMSRVAIQIGETEHTFVGIDPDIIELEVIRSGSDHPLHHPNLFFVHGVGKIHVAAKARTQHR